MLEGVIFINRSKEIGESTEKAEILLEKKTKQREYLCLNSILEKKELQKGEQEGAVFGELEGGGTRGD